MGNMGGSQSSMRGFNNGSADVRCRFRRRPRNRAVSIHVAVARQATKTIPIVMVFTADPVQAGFVTSLARPGGNDLLQDSEVLAPELAARVGAQARDRLGLLTHY